MVMVPTASSLLIGICVEKPPCFLPWSTGGENLREAPIGAGKENGGPKAAASMETQKKVG